MLSPLLRIPSLPFQKCFERALPTTKRLPPSVTSRSHLQQGGLKGVLAVICALLTARHYFGQKNIRVRWSARIAGGASAPSFLPRCMTPCVSPLVKSEEIPFVMFDGEFVFPSVVFLPDIPSCLQEFCSKNGG